MVVRWREVIGTSQANAFFGQANSIYFGLRGADTFTSTTTVDPFFMGGSGGDTYIVNTNNTGMLVADHGGDGIDVIQATGIGLNYSTTQTAAIDQRHLLIFDSATEQGFIIVDWLEPANQIESFVFADGTYSLDYIRSNLTVQTGFSWDQIGKSSADFNEALDFYYARAAALDPAATSESGAIPLSDSVSLTGTDYVDGLLQGSSWQLQPSRLITYTFADTQYGTWSGADRTVLASVFQQWSNVANIRFQEISLSGLPSNNTADITLFKTGHPLGQPESATDSLGIFPDPYTITHLALPSMGYSRAQWQTIEGDIFFANDGSPFNWSSPGERGYTSMLHKVGQALGLKHPHDTGGNDRPTYADLGIENLDEQFVTVMSHNQNGIDAAGNPATPMWADVAAVQAIYGANGAYNSGDNVYRLEDDNIYRTIWDTDGTDTFDGSLRASGLTINLTERAFTYHGARSATAIAVGVTIENALGGFGNDTINGNSAANVLRGGPGTDVLSGFGGNDKLFGDQGDDELFGGEGSDELYGGAATLLVGPSEVAGPVAFSAAVGDFDSDGTQDDIMWLRGGDGQAYLWEMDNSTKSSGAEVVDSLGAVWTLLGVGDFDGDGKVDDILWHRSTDGQTVLWQIENSAVVSSGVVQVSTNLSWKVIGIGDFDGDNKDDDVLWYRNSDGRIYIREMEDGAVVQGHLVKLSTDLSWELSGIGDFDGDGKTDDVLWYRNTDGRVYIRDMENHQITKGYLVQETTNLEWEISGVGDFDGDGKIDDVLWYRVSDGRTYIRQMENHQILSGNLLKDSFDTDWQLVNIGDFDGDGRINDILWRNTTTGDVEIWNIENSQLVGSKDGAAGPVGQGDLLTGGPGDDLFVFEPGDGKNTITDFTPGAGTDDKLDVTAFGYTAFAQVMADASFDGANTTIQLSPTDNIVLSGVNKSSLHANDFADLTPTGNSDFRGPVLELTDIENGNGSLGFVVAGITSNDLSGQSVSFSGDVNGDGLDDVIIGAPGDDPNGSKSGASFILFGSATDITNGVGVFQLSEIEDGRGSFGFVLNGVSAEDESGRSVSSAGDVNGDGFDDVIVGAWFDDPNGSYSGASFVVFGSAADITNGDNVLELSDIENGNGSLGFVLNGVSSDDRSGKSVSSAGDVNGDGFDDLIVGAAYADPNGSHSGANYVVFGSENDITGGDGELDLSDIENGDGTLGFVLNGVSMHDMSGFSVSTAGDINGDGIDDLIIGAVSDDPNGSSSGASFVVYGSKNDITGGDGVFELSDIESGNGVQGFVLYGALRGDSIGWSVSSAGDVNGDGIDDLIIGAPTSDPNGDRSGSSYVVFGSRADISGGDGVFDLADIKNGDGSLGFVLNGISELDLSGWSVSSAGDMNGDGLSDIVIGNRLDDPNGRDSGASFIVFGSANDITGGDGVLELADIENGDGSLGFVVNGVAAYGRSGSSVSMAGDVNGDGFDDIIVGAYLDDPNGSDSGASFVIFGGNFTDSVNIVGTDEADNLAGTAGDDIIIAMQGDDTLTGNAGDDRLTGALGDDLFVFNDGDGDDTIVDFVAGAGTDDVLNVAAFGFADLAAVLSSSQQQNNDVVIALDADDSVTLLGVQLADLHQDDFMLA